MDLSKNKIEKDFLIFIWILLYMYSFIQNCIQNQQIEYPSKRKHTSSIDGRNIFHSRITLYGWIYAMKDLKVFLNTTLYRYAWLPWRNSNNFYVFYRLRLWWVFMSSCGSCDLRSVVEMSASVRTYFPLFIFWNFRIFQL